MLKYDDMLILNTGILSGVFSKVFVRNFLENGGTPYKVTWFLYRVSKLSIPKKVQYYMLNFLKKCQY